MYTGHFFEKMIAYEQYNFHLQTVKSLGGDGFNILTQRYVS